MHNSTRKHDAMNTETKGHFWLYIARDADKELWAPFAEQYNETQ